MNLPRAILTGAWLALAGTGLLAQTNDPAIIYYKQGYANLQRAEKGTTPQERIAALQSARSQFLTMLEIQPGHYRARALLAQTLFGLAKEIPESPARHAAATEARQQFARAAALPDADWRIASAWGRFLTYVATDLTTNDTDRLAALVEAQALFTKATPQVRLPNDRGLLKNTHGQCLYQLALLTPDATQRDERLRAAINCFTDAAQTLPAFADGPAGQSWGTALLTLSPSARAPGIITQAVERLQETLELLPDNAPLRYELARGHALLGQPDQAVRQFRQSLQSSHAEALLARARQELDFASLRERADFQRLFTSSPQTPRHDELIRAAAQAMTRATQAGNDPTALGYRQQAVAFSRQALQALPDSYVAQLFLGENLAELSRRPSPRPDREALLSEAQAAFAAASVLPSADSRAQAAWGKLFLTTADEWIASPAERAGWYQSAVEKFAAGIKLTAYTGERQQLAREQAISLVSLARLRTDINDRRRLLARANEIFTEIAGKLRDQQPARGLRYWGMALAELGKHQNDRMLTRQGVERLLSAMELDPTNLVTRLELARTYVVLGQNDQAFRHLVIGLEQDPVQTKQWIQTERDDLTSLLDMPEFKQKFERP
ncbi:MAG: hypothetical protein WCS70_11465 [Verrucomicrobiota bacterium]